MPCWGKCLLKCCMRVGCIQHTCMHNHGTRPLKRHVYTKYTQVSVTVSYVMYVDMCKLVGMCCTSVVAASLFCGCTYMMHVVYSLHACNCAHVCHHARKQDYKERQYGIHIQVLLRSLAHTAQCPRYSRFRASHTSLYQRQHDTVVQMQGRDNIIRVMRDTCTAYVET
jgi:hypothetical protein